ncbi:hypothetical protein HanIR_Chr15g0749391 [Helianthus annuus]|nr:hypothetical protein HanIR_Chr15g0749391 [Helianthus annuus]
MKLVEKKAIAVQVISCLSYLFCFDYMTFLNISRVLCALMFRERKRGKFREREREREREVKDIVLKK